MATKKTATKMPGVRYREHKTRKYMGKPDMYFSIRYRINGKLKEEGIGWASQGWNATKVSVVLSDLKRNHLTGDGPQTLAEKRELEYAERLRIEKEALKFSSYFKDRYYPEAKENKQPKSYKREKSLHKKWIKPVIGHMTFRDIKPFHLEKLKKVMRNAKKSPRSIQYALAVTRQVFNHAINNESFEGDNPVRKVSKPKVDNKRVRFLSLDEADDLLKEINGRSQRLYEMSLISLHCGLRAGELFDLEWGCVDFKNERLLLMDTKGGVNRSIYITKAVKDMLSQKEPGKPTDLVFPSRKGERIKEVSNAFGRAVDELEFNKGITDDRHKVVFHTLRHTYASWLVQNGVDLYTVQKLMGHSTIAMTERYAHLAPDNLKAAVRVLEKSLEQQKGKPELGKEVTVA